MIARYPHQRKIEMEEEEKSKDLNENMVSSSGKNLGEKFQKYKDLNESMVSSPGENIKRNKTIKDGDIAP